MLLEVIISASTTGGNANGSYPIREDPPSPTLFAMTLSLLSFPKNVNPEEVRDLPAEKVGAMVVVEDVS
jgi:hypothetical protein